MARLFYLLDATRSRNDAFAYFDMQSWRHRNLQLVVFNIIQGYAENVAYLYMQGYPFLQCNITPGYSMVLVPP